MALKTDYKNYIPDANGRVYSITQNAQGKSVITDETNYAQVGDNFGANDINAITTAINKLNKIVSITIPANDSTNYTEHTDSSGNTYYSIQIALSSITADSSPMFALKIDDPLNLAQLKILRKQFSNLIYYECTDGYIEFGISKLPTNSMVVELKGV